MSAHGKAERIIGYGRQTIGQSDIDAVVAVLKGDFLTQGPAVPAFEQALTEYTGAKYAVAVSSGTAALHLACLAGGMKPGDIGITQPITFAASANCIAYCGGRVDLCDVDPDTMMMSPVRLAETLERLPQAHTIIPVSYGGLSSGGEALRTAAGPDRIIIEDASHSFGATDQNGGKIGASAWANMTVFSFHPVKPITTGEGGAILTDDSELHHRLQLLRSHGIEREADRFVSGSAADPWWHEQQCLGYNYRLCDIQAALGVSQSTRIDAFIQRRRDIASVYDRAFSVLRNVRLVQADPAQRARSGHHLYVVRLDYQAIGRTRSDLMKSLRERGVGTQVHYIPVYKHPYHASALPGGAQLYPESEAYFHETLTIPCYPGMSDEDVNVVVDAITGLLAG